MAAYFEEGSEAMLALEAMVDKVGLDNVLFALAHICRAKAEHVQTNWQDRDMARAWEKNAGVVERTTRATISTS